MMELLAPLHEVLIKYSLVTACAVWGDDGDFLHGVGMFVGTVGDLPIDTVRCSVVRARETHSCQSFI